MDRDLIILDFDGTLADTDTIGHLMGDWDEFHPASFRCPPRSGVVELVKRLQTVARIVVVTGKPARFRQLMVSWLDREGIHPDEVLMRPDWSTLPDIELKFALLHDWEPLWESQVICSIEDRDKMVDAWRAAGVLCLQAAPCLETRMKKEAQSAE